MVEVTGGREVPDNDKEMKLTEGEDELWEVLEMGQRKRGNRWEISSRKEEMKRGTERNTSAFKKTEFGERSPMAVEKGFPQLRRQYKGGHNG